MPPNRTKGAACSIDRFNGLGSANRFNGFRQPPAVRKPLKRFTPHSPQTVETVHPRRDHRPNARQPFQRFRPPERAAEPFQRF